MNCPYMIWVLFSINSLRIAIEVLRIWRWSWRLSLVLIVCFLFIPFCYVHRWTVVGHVERRWVVSTDTCRGNSWIAPWGDSPDGSFGGWVIYVFRNCYVLELFNEKKLGVLSAEHSLCSVYSIFRVWFSNPTQPWTLPHEVSLKGDWPQICCTNQVRVWPALPRKQGFNSPPAIHRTSHGAS